jgi:hypothetical protein
LSLEDKLVEWHLRMNLNKSIECRTSTVCGEWRVASGEND